ncbi:family 14 glycosylhydrolase [Herbiconiux moechotypicola]|uniref:Beta-amylase n=1 Tax=Herbiconiux moechotypicola TaxID=637393 RepID=A0ABN3DN87_9MICO|nr:family 14 glycosylhydrolase [Herbiconiux moechotypicola]MCS5730363.1 family 14 glycosylhydrolase [Herbiconiux moechotypicola]
MKSQIPTRGLAAAALLCGAALSVSPLVPLASASAGTGAARTVNLMAPLFIDDWASSGPQWRAFTSSLAVADRQGVDAVAVDVWWGTAEPERGVFDWSYYDKVFAAITSAGLDLVPLMSFHECKSNVGDVCDISVPDWVWEPYQICGVTGWCSEVPVENYYVSEYGNVNKEAPAPWGTGNDRALADMRGFMNAFEEHYTQGATDYRGRVQELSISTGPAGELRYPSYNAHDKSVPGNPAGYPNRGTFQSSSPAAVRSFADWAVARYGSVAGVAAAWSIPGLSYAAITPPTDHERFITSGSYHSLRYGRDFTRWYHESLLQHGREVMRQAVGAFDEGFASVPLGFKIPGVHWQTMATSPMRRAPEIAAGMLHTDQDYNGSSTDFGYDGIVSLARELRSETDGGRAPAHAVTLHFTALEMPDGREWDGADHAYSDAASLVRWVGAAAGKSGVTLKGENALADNLGSAGTPSTVGWSHIRDAFSGTPSAYSGLTVLRLPQVTGSATSTGRVEFERFLRDFH